jgi:hypothetical protein
LKSDDPAKPLGSSPKVEIHPEGSNPQHKPGLIALLVFLLGILLVMSLFTGRQVRRVHRRKREDVASTNLQGFRDGGTDNNINFAAPPTGGLQFPSFADPRGTMKRKDSFKRSDSFSRGVHRSDSFDRDVYHSGSFNRRGVQRSDSFDTPGRGTRGVQRSDSFDSPVRVNSFKGKLYEIAFV